MLIRGHQRDPVEPCLIRNERQRHTGAARVDHPHVGDGPGKGVHVQHPGSKSVLVNRTATPSLIGEASAHDRYDGGDVRHRDDERVRRHRTVVVAHAHGDRERAVGTDRRAMPPSSGRSSDR